MRRCSSCEQPRNIEWESRVPPRSANGVDHDPGEGLRVGIPQPGVGRQVAQVGGVCLIALDPSYLDTSGSDHIQARNAARRAAGSLEVKLEISKVVRGACAGLSATQARGGRGDCSGGSWDGLRARGESRRAEVGQRQGRRATGAPIA